LGAYPIISELLQAFLENKAVLSSLESQRQPWIFDALANAHSVSGYPERAVQLLNDSIQIDRVLGEKERLAATLQRSTEEDGAPFCCHQAISFTVRLRTLQQNYYNLFIIEVLLCLLLAKYTSLL